jgi:hypothetical protein
MNPFSKILGDLLGKVTGIIDDLHLSGEEKAAAHLKAIEIQRAAELEMAKIDVQWAELQSKVVIAEAQGHSWLQRNWRPLSMLAFVAVILYQYIVSPIFGTASAPSLPADLWDVIQIGFGGYIVGRTLEKTAPRVAEILKK